MTTVDRPLALGELLAETVRMYGERFWAAIGIGAVVAGAFLVAILTHWAIQIVVVPSAFAACYAAAARVVSGDDFSEAWAQVAVRAGELLALAGVVALPLVLGLLELGYLFLLPAAGWLAFAGFSIPVVMLEREGGLHGVFGRIAYGLDRAMALARVEYLHAVGVAAALMIATLLIGIVLSVTLAGFADNSGVAAAILVQLVLAPFFFFGLSILYFEQKARAVSSPRPRKT